MLTHTWEGPMDQHIWWQSLGGNTQQHHYILTPYPKFLFSAPLVLLFQYFDYASYFLMFSLSLDISCPKIVENIFLKVFFIEYPKDAVKAYMRHINIVQPTCNCWPHLCTPLPWSPASSFSPQGRKYHDWAEGLMLRQLVLCSVSDCSETTLDKDFLNWYFTLAGF